MRLYNFLVTGSDLKRCVNEGWMLRVDRSADIPDDICVTKAVASSFVKLDAFENTTPTTMPFWQELIPLPVLPENAVMGTGMGYFPDTPIRGQLVINTSLRLDVAFDSPQTFIATLRFQVYLHPGTFESLEMNVDINVTVPANVTDLGSFVVYRGPTIYYGLATNGDPCKVTPGVIGGFRMRGGFRNP